MEIKVEGNRIFTRETKQFLRGKMKKRFQGKVRKMDLLKYERNEKKEKTIFYMRTFLST